MGIRTVRLDDEAELELARLRSATGLSISEVLKRGLKAYRAEVAGETSRAPYEIYKQLDLGPGDEMLVRAFELMLQHADAPMDLADASLVATAEGENVRKVFTVDRRVFAMYRVRRGHRWHALEVIG